MPNLEKLKQIIATDNRFKGKTPEEIFDIGSVEDQPLPPPPPVKTALTTWEAAGLGLVTLDDVKDALAPKPPQKRSPDGTPGSVSIEAEGDKFRLHWDGKPAPDAPLFDALVDAKQWQQDWYDDHPPVLVADVAVEAEAIEVKP